MEIPKKATRTSVTVAGRNSNTRPPNDDRELIITDAEEQKLRIRRICGRTRKRGTECIWKECWYVKRWEADEHRARTGSTWA